MDNINWLDVSIETTSDGIDPVCARIIALGIEGMQIEDFEDFEDFLENNRQYWDYVDESLVEQKRGATKVKVYLSDNPSGWDTLSLLRSEISALKAAMPDADLGSLEITVNTIHPEDWESNWKQYYHPTPIGKKLLIVPQWEDIPQTDRAVFINNPGMSFGTGPHASTRLALECLEKRIKPGDSIIDLGCGSGILAICGLLMGGSFADAVDIDPNAAEVTQRNAELNGIGRDRLCTYAGNILTDMSLAERMGNKVYDIVLANIIADVIVQLPDIVRRMIKPGGIFISSGIIEGRLGDVLAALNKGGFTVLETLSDDGWSSVTATI